MSVPSQIRSDSEIADADTAQMFSPEEALRILANDPSLTDRRTIFGVLQYQLIVDPKSFMDNIIDAGLLPHIIENLGYPDSQVQYDCARALNCIVTRDSTELVRKVINSGGIGAFLKGVDSDHAFTLTQCWLGLAQVVGRGHAKLDELVQSGLVDKFVNACQDVSKITNDLALVLSIVAERLCTIENGYTIQAVIMPSLMQLMKFSYGRTQENICFGIGNIGPRNDEQAVFLHGYNVLDVAVPLLNSRKRGTPEGALFLCSCFVYGSTRQSLLDHGFLDYLPRLFDFRDERVHIDLCDTLADILDSNVDHVQAVYDAGLIFELIRELRHEEYEVRWNAVRCFYHITLVGSEFQILRLGRWGLVFAISRCLANVFNDSDDSFKLRVLVIVKSILNAANYPGSNELYHYMGQFTTNYGLEMLENMRNTGTDEMRSIVDGINCFYRVGAAA